MLEARVNVCRGESLRRLEFSHLQYGAAVVFGSVVSA